MGRPKADLKAYSPWGSYPISAPAPPNPAWLPVVPNQGILTFSDLAMYALRFPGVNPMVGLFTNFYQPIQDTVLADLTSPTAPGLIEQPLPMPIRGGLDAGGRATWTWPLISFVATGGGLPVQVWGYYVWCTDPWTQTPGLLWVQRFPRSFGFANPGDTLRVPLAISFGQC